MIDESIERLHAADTFLARYNLNKGTPELESAILQARKAFEATAFAAIAPNKSEYQAFRAKADIQPDYTKDFNARSILIALEKINKDFYPLALLPAVRKPDGTLHFERKPSGYLTKARFINFYDRFGKYLHADNPWGNNKNLLNLAAELPSAINELFELLELHVTFIQTPSFSGAWVVEAFRNGPAPNVTCATARGEFPVVGI